MADLIAPPTVQRALDTVSERLQGLDDERRADLEAGLAIDVAERVGWQNAKSRLHAAGTLPTDLATWLYRVIGEVGSEANGGWPVDVTLAEKAVCTEVMAQVLQALVGRGKA